MLVALLVLSLITAFATVPIDTGPLLSSPHPAADYASAVARFDAMRARDSGLVMSDGASLSYVHGQRTPRAVVLIHGLTNSPRQFRDLALLLSERGDNVIVPRLPFHGLLAADVEVLRDVTAERYRSYADTAVDIARGLGDTVIVVGLSAGGNVAIWIVQHRADVARVVIISPALTLARIPHLLAAPTMNVLERVPNFTIRQRPDTLRPHAYFGVSTRGLGETLRLGASVMEDVERDPPRVRDIAMLLNDNDRTVSERSALSLVERWRTRDGVAVTLYRFPRALGLPHDLVDVSQRCGMPAVVYPVIIALMDRRAIPDAGKQPPPCAEAATDVK
ncbi:MAG: putative esterase [Gemmatimonadetes bacterium]|nr:putative esterase [Gemmatimonadota bacterium]